MRLVFATVICVLVFAGALCAEPTKMTVYNYSSINTFVIVLRGKQPNWFPVPKGNGNVVSTPLAKDKSDRVFTVYQTDKTATDISDPAVVAGVGSVKMTSIPGQELVVYVQDSGKPGQVDIIFWSLSLGEYKLGPDQILRTGFDQKAAVEKMKEGAATAKPLEKIGP